MKRSTILTQIALVAGILIILNLISEKLYFRLDFTEDSRYTLSKATKNILKELDEVITVKAYFTDDLPSQLAYVKNDLRDQLIEYENTSNGNVVFEFINPNESDERKQEALQNGIAPLSINVVEDDQRQQIQAFLGVVFQSGDQKEVIPIVQPGASMEYDLTTSIKKIAIKDKPKVGFLQGFGEPGLNEIPQLLQQLNVLYEVEPFNFNDTSIVPLSYRSLIWIDPKDSIPESEFSKLDQYLRSGGNLMLAYSNLQGDLQTGRLSEKGDNGIRSWLMQKGVSLGSDFVIDAQCASVTVQQRSGFFTINSQIEFPYFPQLTNFSEHPITSGLEGVLMPFVSSVSSLSKDTSKVFTPLVYSSEISGVQSAPIIVDIQKKWKESDFTAPSQVLGALIESNNTLGSIVFFPNSQFIVNGSGQQAQQVNPDNVNLVSNAIDYISDDTGLIELRTKGVTSRPLDQIEDSRRNILKYSNVIVPIVLIIIYGIIRKSRLSRKRQKWSQGNYA